MKLLITLITHNRLEYTQRTLKSLAKTLNHPVSITIVDNNSTDGTQKFIRAFALKPIYWGFPAGFMDSILNPENFYPGKACNIGWAEGLKRCPDATHLMRCDNDMEFAPGWMTKAEDYFNKMPILGQLGLDYTALEGYNGNPDYLSTIDGKTVNMWPGNVGGPCIITREAWDRGARYDESPWYHEGDGKPTAQEDVKFSFLMHRMGYIYGHATDKLAWTFATPETWGEYPDYYKKTMSERGYEYGP